ncbi:MAG: FAD:protein FMN transferase [Gammaproteobacteria bacterium]|nr:FAD:protein FMN transferase [Gammaproteobacteria bacterium]
MYRFSGSAMGTQYTVKVVELPAAVLPTALGEDIVRLLGEVDTKMSTYRSDSELSRFNDARSTQWIPVSQEMITVVDEALRVSTMTQGAFDITVGPLVDIWGFGPTLRPERIPAKLEIDSELARVGFRHVHTRENPPALKKDLEEIYIDLSAIAKGYAVDKVADHLDGLEISNYMIEVGGELRLKGYNTHRIPWKIAVERPAPEVRAIHSVIQPGDKGVATSGDYRNYFEQEGKRYSHTIDPRSGLPIDHSLASVTVIADTAMYADAMATAFMVIGSTEGYSLAQRNNLAVFFVSKSATGFTEQATPAFSRYFLANE